MHIIDSHTAGEPTRVVLSGGPPLQGRTLAERRDHFASHFDHYRSAIACEPRGSDALVGALLTPPTDPASTAAVIFFNNVGYLGMCGHGTIGLAATLAHLGRIAPGLHRLETPVGTVTMELHPEGDVTVHNVPSYRTETRVRAAEATGDIAWGGNWFFLTEDAPCPLTLANLDQLTAYAWHLRQSLNRPEIDHIEISQGHRNFVLCPGKAYDRSPCGTGTSAKLACLYADGKLAEGETWLQEGFLGGTFQGSVTIRDGQIHPKIRGRAHITAESHLLFHEADPFRWGIRP